MSTLATDQPETSDKPQQDSAKNIIPKQVEVSIVDHEPAPEDIPEALKPKPQDKVEDCKDWFGGIGIHENGLGLVQKVIPGYPAHKAGIKEGDQIIYTSEPDIRGEPGTSFQMTIRTAAGDFRHFTITRDKICTD